MAEKAQDISILTDAQDIVVVRPSGKGSYVFAVKPSLDFQRQTYEESVSNPEDAGVPAFSTYWQFDEKRGIRGSNTFHALRYDKRALRPKGLWLPGLIEARFLDKAGKLENGVYRDYDLVVYNDKNPNKEIAKAFSEQAEQLGLNLPLINPFMALDYNMKQESAHGIDLSFVQAPQGIISGKEAQGALASLDYRGNSGAQRLGRGRVGLWVASWDYLDYSIEYGRVDWICGEATQKNLMDTYNTLLERTDEKQIKELGARRQEKLSAFEKSLKQ